MSTHRITHPTNPTGRTADQRTHSFEIRPLRSGEDHLIREVFARLSGQARFERFHSPTPRLTEGLVRGLAEVRDGHQGSLIAFADGHAVGHVMWVREAERARRAEVAVAVADAFQGRGLGKALIHRAARHVATLGVSELLCHVHYDNARIRGLLSALGGHRGKDGIWVLSASALAHRADPGPSVLRWTDAVPRPRSPAGTDRRRH